MGIALPSALEQGDAPVPVPSPRQAPRAVLGSPSTSERGAFVRKDRALSKSHTQTGFSPGERQPKDGGLTPEVTVCLQLQ